MKIETGSGKATKRGERMTQFEDANFSTRPCPGTIGYMSEADKGTAPITASSRLPVFEIDPNKGRTPLDDFMTSQDPVTSFVRGFFKGIFKVVKVVFYSLGFIIPFWLVLNYL